MEGTAGFSKAAKDERSWRSFHPGPWRDSIDVRDFIVRNVTSYAEDEKFLAAPSQRTKAVWAKLQPYFKKGTEKGRARGRCENALAPPGAQSRLYRSRQRGDRRTANR